VLRGIDFRLKHLRLCDWIQFSRLAENSYLEFVTILFTESSAFHVSYQISFKIFVFVMVWNCSRRLSLNNLIFLVGIYSKSNESRHDILKQLHDLITSVTNRGVLYEWTHLDSEC